MILVTLTVLSLLCAAIPFGLFLRNITLYRCTKKGVQTSGKVSVLIPARNEAATIQRSLRSILDGHPVEPDGVEIEVLVMDDDSDDETPTLVRKIAETDSRLKLLSAPPLPNGWCGKQHACFRLAESARFDLLLFLDADVRLEPGSIPRMVNGLEQSGAELISGFPRQETGTLLEKLVLPLMHFVLLGFLPMDGMRRSTMPSFSAGCGQLFLARRRAYETAGGHAAMRETLHDGVKLPRLFRTAGFRTDLFDATDLAHCRMYRDAKSLWEGLVKNSREGLGAPKAIVPFTLLLGFGQVLPPVLLAMTLATHRDAPANPPLALSATAVLLSLAPRLIATLRFRQSWLGAAFHPLGVLILLILQWVGLFGPWLGKRSTWKGRTYDLSR